MSVPVMLAFGALAGLGLLLAASGMWPARASLAQMLHAVHPPAARLPRPGLEPGGWAARFGRPLAPLLAGFGLPRPSLAADLRLCDRSPGRHAAEQATAILAGLAAPYLLVGLLWAAGLPVGWVLPVWLSLIAAVLAAVWLDLRVRQEAARRREALRQALSVQLDLTMMSLAGGAGLEQAVTDAASIGDGWAHQRLRRALQAAAQARLAMWDTLADLGRTTAVPELEQLATAVGLAGEEGAKIRDTLGARAAAMRQRQLYQTEATAAAATERMTLPSTLLLAGFLLTVGFPAVATMMTGFQ
jgi:Flp pilus assembly protein TadB